MGLVRIRDIHASLHSIEWWLKLQRLILFDIVLIRSNRLGWTVRVSDVVQLDPRSHLRGFMLREPLARQFVFQEDVLRVVREVDPAISGNAS